MKLPFPAPAVVSLLVAAAVTRPALPADWPLTIAAIPSPASAESGQPQLSASERGVILSWIERSGATATLRFARLLEGTGENGMHWADARTVASGSDWFVNWADVPSVVQIEGGALAAHWLQKSGSSTYAYDVRLSLSTDDGKTWTPSFTPHHDGTQTEHGFASLFPMPAGGLGLVWLDGRAMAGGHGGHGGDMSLRFTSFDRPGNQASETAVDARVCECCPTAAAVTAGGVIAAYRDRSADEVRDIHVTRLENGTWTEPVPVHADGWRIPACPVNGPALSARGRTVAIAWYTMKNEKGHAQVAFSTDAGRSFAAPIPLADGDTIGRVDVALLDDGAAVASWIEVAGPRATFRIRRVDPSGAKSPAITVAEVESGRGSGYPRLARQGSRLVFAWTARERGSQVRTAVAKLPSR